MRRALPPSDEYLREVDCRDEWAAALFAEEMHQTWRLPAPVYPLGYGPIVWLELREVDGTRVRCSEGVPS